MHVDNLPAELLSTIFCYMLPIYQGPNFREPKLQLLKSLCLCSKRWKHIAYSTAPLWAHFNVTRSVSLRRTLRLLDRCKAAWIYVKIMGSSVIPGVASTVTKEDFHRSIMALSKQATQWRTLFVMWPPEERLELEDILPSGLSNIVEANIFDAKSNSNIGQRPWSAAPSLKRLSLDGRPSFMFHTCLNLLRITLTTFTTADWREKTFSLLSGLAENCPQLEAIEYKACRWENEIKGDQTQAPSSRLTFNSLKYISFDECHFLTFVLILQVIDLPYTQLIVHIIHPIITSLELSRSHNVRIPASTVWMSRITLQDVHEFVCQMENSDSFILEVEGRSAFDGVDISNKEHIGWWETIKRRTKLVNWKFPHGVCVDMHAANALEDVKALMEKMDLS